MTELVKAHPSVLASTQIMGPEQFDNAFRMAKALHASGQFKDISNAEQAFGRMLIGADLGLSPSQALMTINVVRGNVQLRGKLLLSWIRASENYDYEVIERTPERGAIQFYEKSKRTGEWVKVGPRKDPNDPRSEPGPIAFTLEEAKKKGLVKADGGWDKWPEQMCLWRCASIGFNLFCPELSRGTPVYTEADVFDSTAVEIGAGEGSGEPPGWEGLSDERVEEVEALISMAEAFGVSLDLGSVQMRLNSQPDEVIEAWLVDTRESLAKRAPEDEKGGDA